MGAAVGTVIPGAGNAVGGAVGALVGCLGPGAIAAWSGQTQPLMPVGQPVTTQVPIAPGGVQPKGGGTSYAGGSAPGWEAQYRGTPTPTPAVSITPWLLAGGLALAVVLFALSRRR